MADSLPAKKRPLFARRRIPPLAWAGVGVAFAFGLHYWYQHRTITLRQALNPFFWAARLRGDDCFDAQSGLLMSGNRTLPEVVLTFDDGPHPESRERILAALKQYGAKAVFFDVGARMAEHPDLLLRTLAEGHEIANHSTNHYRLPPLSPAQRHREINDADITYFRLTGQHLRYFRPPGMRYDAATLADLKRLGYITVGYTLATGDYTEEAEATRIADIAIRRVGNGSVLLLHDYPATAEALPRILEELKQRGIRCVTLAELLDHLQERPKAALQTYLQNNPETASEALASKKNADLRK